MLLDQGTLICYYSLNNPVTDARYSGQLTESCSLIEYMFIALTLLVAACEKPILDEEDAVTRKEANVILHMTQYEQEAFGNSGNRAATRATTDITELCSRLNIAIFDDGGTKV